MAVHIFYATPTPQRTNRTCAVRHARLWAGAACRMNASATTPTCVSRWASAVAVMARALRSARRFGIVNDLNLHGHLWIVLLIAFGVPSGCVVSQKCCFSNKIVKYIRI